MGVRLLLYLAILILGGFIGFKELINKKIYQKMNLIQSLCLLFLLFIMGIRIGLDRSVVASFGKLGFQSLIISFFSIAFSVILVRLIKGYISVDEKEGEVTDEH